MSHNDDLAWGVPNDAPPPRSRTTWGQGKQQGAPVERTDTPGPVEPVAEVEPAQWAPIVDPHDTSSTVAPAPAADIVDNPFAGAANPFVEHDTPTSPDTGAPATSPAVTPETQDVPSAFADVAPATEPEVADEHTASPTATGLAEALLPEVFTEEATFSAPVPVGHGLQAEDDLAAMFDEHPAVPAVAEAHTAPETYSTREDALSAWKQASMERQRARTEETQAAAVTQEEAAGLAHRYSSTARLRPVVEQLLGLAQSGNTVVQSTLTSFVLTRDHDLDAHQRDTYEQLMVPLMERQHIRVEDPRDVKTVFDIAYDELIGIGPLGPLWRDDSITEIMVSGPNKVIVERDGKLIPTPVKFRDLEHLKQTSRDLAQRIDDRVVSPSNPAVTAQLPGARVQFAVAPVAPVSGVSITIRKFRPLFGLEELLKFGAMNEEMASFLSDVVQARATVLVSGGTGSGKTTMINALSAFIPDSERVITIEDALELSLSNTHVEALLTKELASGDDTVIIGQDTLLKAALRMRPDRIIVGEIRDGHGCATMLQAANTGHDGTMTTVHANNPDRALRRLAMLLRTTENMNDEVAAEEVRTAFDLIVQVVRVRNRRFVSAISAVNKDSNETVMLFRGSFTPGQANPTFERVGGIGSDTELAQRLFDAGLDPTVWE